MRSTVAYYAEDRDIYPMRKKYFKENFSYVEPVQIEISANSNRFIYYVPILRTLESLFNGGFGLIPLLFTDHRKIDGFMTNYTEGLRFMNNMFCQQPNSLHIFLYQDGFGTVNPLGDAKVRHKLVGVYFTIGNMHPALRATTENSFLVLMCLEKDLKQYGTEAIFKVLIDDLKLLETEGMHINIAETEVVIHGTIFALLGDNLGTHQMAGLVENFSTQQYFSRYCYSTLQEFRRTPLKSCQMRYQATYEKDLQDLYTSGKPIRGVKKPTIFNELKHFQLFEYGMPPCLAHDLFLGCFNYDIMLVLRRFIRNKLVREQYLQRRLNYLLKKFELNSKICLNFKKKCVTSKAIDIWHMIQVIPLLLLKIKQVHTDPAFKLIIMLKNITDIITAPLISIRQIAMLKLEISQYLEIRSSLFMTPLRPKHHYLFHYPHLILQYGPLMQFSTLSGERKHSYFKTALRHAGNYKNILKLCCERHQYWQAYLSTNRQRFHEKVVFEGNVRTCNDLDGDEKQVMESLACYGEYNKYTNSIIYMGTPLKRGYCVFIRHDDYEDSFYIILIHGIVCNDITNDIMVYGEKQTAFYFTELGMPVVEHGNCTKSLSCMNVNELPDITPLKQYTCQGNTYLFNKHAIPRK